MSVASNRVKRSRKFRIAAMNSENGGLDNKERGIGL